MATTLVKFESIGSVEAFGAEGAIFVQFLTRESGFSLVDGPLMLIKGRVLAKHLTTVSDFTAISFSVFMKREMSFQSLCCCKALVAIIPVAEIVLLLYVGRGNMAL